MNVLSKCCLKPVIVGYKHEYPLGGEVWRETYKIDACEGCGMQVEEYVEVCEICDETGCYGECDSECID